MNAADAHGREAAGDVPPPMRGVLDPVDRVSEGVFGLLMALSFTGSLSVASSGQEDVRTMMFAALGCNLAWGLVDAVMYLVRTQVAKGRDNALMRAVRNAGDPATGRARLAAALPGGLAGRLSQYAVEGLRRGLLDLPAQARRPSLTRRDLAAGFAAFALVVLATFPVVIPFMHIGETRLAMRVSNGTAIVMLYGAGLALGRYADLGAVRTGLWMVGLGIVMVGAIMLFGG